MNDQLHDALNQISDTHLSESLLYKKRRRPYWITAVAALLAVILAVSAIPGWRDATEPTSGGVPTGTQPDGSTNPTFTTAPSYLYNMVASPAYPQMTQFPSRDSYEDNWKAYYEAESIWWQSQRDFYDQPKDYADSLNQFFHSSISAFLTGTENAAYSPLSVYMALSMLAETTDGNSRQQILDLFGLSSIEELRAQVNYLWNAHYSADGRTDLLLANSLWLDEAYSFRRETVDRLASDYFASSFHGDLGTQEMDEQLRRWLNENTGELLYDQVQNLSMPPETVFALASSVYFTARWENEFSEKDTADAVFHSPDGDQTVPFMNQSLFAVTYYWADQFSAVKLDLSGYNKMWIILPDEGVTVEQVLESGEYLNMTLDPENWKNQKSGMIVHLSLPKFDVSSDIDLSQGLNDLGITDVFRPEVSDFTPLTDTPMLYLSSAKHAARVAIDEEGVVGAAYTMLMVAGSAAPEDEVDFVVDRPFLFVVSSRDNLPIFAGTVLEP